MHIVIAKVNQQEISNLPRDLYIDPEALQVFLDTFEGPLDLLLYLIRNQNLDILAIPIAKITHQYINYINAMQVLNIDLAAEYLLMAAMLLEIKSRMLLPKPKLSDELENSDIDPRQALVQKLIAYEKIKFGAHRLSELPTANRDYLWLDVATNDSYKELSQVTVEGLKTVWHSLILRNMCKQREHHIKRQELSVREYMSDILRKLSHFKCISFLELFDPTQGIAYVVVNFIAVLELAKEGLVRLSNLEHQGVMVSLS